MQPSSTVDTRQRSLVPPETVQRLKIFLEDHRCSDIRAFDISENSSLADYAVVATVSGSGHLRGVSRHLHAFLEENGLYPKSPSKKISSESWVFMDCSSVLIHLMNADARRFYQLEDLWFRDREI